jgi:hypothetical protein
LGVTPAAEDVVIGAAYRALMRHYHPDTNPDPQAQERAREITAAYAILRDPVKRAEYDAHRAEGVETWPIEEAPRPTPPMRAAGIVAALLAVVLTTAVWLSPKDQPVRETMAPPAREHAVTKHESAKPIVALAPEKDRLASLAADIAPAVPPPPPVVEPVVEDPPLAAAPPPRSVAAKSPRLAIAQPPKPSKPLSSVSLPARSEPAKAALPRQAERVATLDRMSTSFFSQSMVNADDAKKELLVAARDRSEANRKACRSDKCVADAYVRQIRETSAIMEGRPETPK